MDVLSQVPWGDIGPTGLLTLTVLAIIQGWLVPRLTGKWVDLVGAPPVATVVMTASSAARPTSDPSVRVIFYTPTPPVAVMLAGDVWEPTV